MIQPASLPAIAMAAITGYVGAHHLLVWLRARRGPLDLLFAATCLCVSFYDVSCAGLYSAASVAEGMPWQRFQRVTVALAGVAFAWFVREYTGRLRRWIATAVSVIGVFSALALALGPTWIFSDEPAVKVVHFPWGSTVTYYEVLVRPFGYTLELFGVLLFASALVAAVRQLRQGERSRAVPLLAALVVMSAGVANDIGVALQLLPTLYVIEYAFMALVVLMAYSLAGEVLRAERMERALRESEVRYRSLVEETDDLVLQVGADGRILFANRGAAETFGVPNEGLLGMAALDLVHPAERDDLGGVLQAVLRGEWRQRTVEVRHVTVADRELDVLWRVTAMTDGAGAVQSLNAIGRDITERKQAEEGSFARYQRLERQQEAILRIALDEAVMAGDVARVARRVSERAAEILGAARVAVWRVVEGGHRISVLDLYERESKRHSGGAALSIDDSPYFASIVRDRVVASEDVLVDPRLAEFRESYLRPHDVGALLEAPIRVAGWFVGTLRVEHVGGPRGWLDDEILFVGELADQMAQVLLNADRHKAEESLRMSESRYRAMLEAMDDLVYICSSDHRIQYMNAAMVRRTGRDATGELCHWALHGLKDVCPWCSSDPIPPGESLKQEITSPRDGRAYHVSNVPIQNPGGTVAKMAILRDITAMRQAGAERRLLSEAIEQAAEMILVTDTDGVIEYVNPAFEQVTGFSRTEAVGRTPNILKSGKHDADFYDDLWGTIRTGRTWHGRLTNRKRDGTHYLEEAVISPVRDEVGRLTHFVGVKRDITAQVRLEEQLRQMQKMEAIGQLAGGVAHDFNNLLTPILGYAELLQARFPPDDPTHAAVGEIRRAGEGARRLTAQLLAFGRKQMIELQVVDLSSLVARTSRMLRRTIREDVEVVVKRSPEASHVRVDVSQIEQVLMNLALNAQDALPAGGHMVIETANVIVGDGDGGEAVRPGLAPGAYAVLSVSDTGVGMDAETLSRLFEPFFTTKEKGKGTGLGLATAYGIVKQHGGEITAYSEPGRGATFRVYLPRTDEAPAETERALRPRTLQQGAETVLVVEDNPLVRNLASNMLEAYGYTVLRAASGEECLRQIEEHGDTIHLLLVDVIMPGMNGREVHERVAALRPEIRVLFMSGYAEDIIAPQGMLQKDVDFIAKPFSVESLTGKVREILDR